MFPNGNLPKDAKDAERGVPPRIPVIKGLPKRLEFPWFFSKKCLVPIKKLVTPLMVECWNRFFASKTRNIPTEFRRFQNRQETMVIEFFP